MIKYTTDAKIEIPGDTECDPAVVCWIKGGTTATIKRGGATHLDLSQAQLRWLAQWARRISDDLGPDIAPKEARDETGA